MPLTASSVSGSGPPGPSAHDPTGTPRPDAFRAAVLAVGLHAGALLLLALWAESKTILPTTVPDMIRVTLLAPPSRQRTAETPSPVQPHEFDTLDEATPPVESLPSELPRPESPVVQADFEEPPPAQGPEWAPARIASQMVAPELEGSPGVDLAGLRLQLTNLTPISRDTDEAGAPGTVQPSPAMPWTERGDSVRGLPLGGGWMNPYVGPVQPRSETWDSPTGERRGYFVLNNGQAICTRRAAPSFAELIHPWKAMAVTYAWGCGRQRGTAPSAVDLDYAPAPAALREGTRSGREMEEAVP